MTEGRCGKNKLEGWFPPNRTHVCKLPQGHEGKHACSQCDKQWIG